MTVIAWDGKTMAADKQTNDAGMRRRTTKIWRAQGGALLGAAGKTHLCGAMRDWWAAGADAAKCPAKDDGDVTLLVVMRRGNGQPTILVFDGGPHASVFEDPFVAIGCGRDFATTAMHLGKSAREAVEITCIFEAHCGNGVDVLELEP